MQQQNMNNTEVKMVHHHPYRQGTTLLHETKKQKLIAMSSKVYSDATECEIKADTVQFGKQMLEYRSKILNKRKRIGELLGLPLAGVDGRDSVDEELMEMLAAAATLAAAPPNKEGGAISSSVGPVGRDDTKEQSLAMIKNIHDAESTTTTTANNKNQVDYALSESILLLRHETVKLEKNVSQLLRKQMAEICNCTNNKTNDVTPATSVVDIINDNALNDVIFSSMKRKLTTPGGSTTMMEEGGGVRRLASRIMQNDGEEIVIFEHC